MLARQTLSPTNVRKFMCAIGGILPAALIICLIYTTKSDLAVLFFTISMFVSGASSAGPNCILIHMSGGYAGILEGFANGIASAAGVVAPLFIGFVLDKGGCPRDSTPSTHSAKSPACHQAWQMVFYFAAASFIAGLA